MRGRSWLGAGVALVLVLGACGGDDDGGTDASGDDNGAAANAAEAFGFTTSECRDIALAIAAGSASAFTGGGGDGFAQARETMERFADAAPSEIAADVRVMAAYIEDLAGVFADAGLDLTDPQAFLQPENIQKLQGLESRFDEFDTEEVQAAGDRIDAYLQDRCATG